MPNWYPQGVTSHATTFFPSSADPMHRDVSMTHKERSKEIVVALANGMSSHNIRWHSPTHWAESSSRAGNKKYRHPSENYSWIPGRTPPPNKIITGYYTPKVNSDKVLQVHPQSAPQPRLDPIPLMNLNPVPPTQRDTQPLNGPKPCPIPY